MQLAASPALWTTLASVRIAPQARTAGVQLCAKPETFAGLVVCTNSNICGKENPVTLAGIPTHVASSVQHPVAEAVPQGRFVRWQTNVYGWGWAFRAIECIRVLGPPGLEVLPGPCFIRCSRGVNAKLVLPDGARESQFEGRRLTDGTPYFRLNSLELCVGWLEDELGVSPSPELLRAYREYAEACVLLNDSINGPIRGDIEYNSIRIESTASANAARPLLEAAAAYILADGAPAGGWPPAPATQRRSFCDSLWTESFYDSIMGFSLDSEGAAAQPQLATGAGGAAFGGGSADEADAALDAARQALKAKPSGLSAEPPVSSGPVQLRGAYGTPVWSRAGTVYSGRLKCVQSGGTLRGTWDEEGGSSGTLEMEMSEDGLSFSGRGASASESYEWSGTRLAPPFLSSRGSARQRWQARVLALLSRAQLQLKQLDEAAESAAHAVRFCPWLPAAWEAVAETALAAGDSRAARMALQELLYLQPDNTPNLPLRVANTRRTQRLVLGQIVRGELKLGPSLLSGLNPVVPYLLSDSPSVAAVTAGEEARTGEDDPRQEGKQAPAADPLQSQLDAIFVDSYNVQDL